MRMLITAATVVLLVLACVPTYAHEGQVLLLPRVPMSFCGIVGAITLVLLGVGLNFPYSLSVLGLTSLIASSRIGQRRWRVWIAAGIVYVMPSLFLYREHYLYQFTPYGHVAYELVGFVSASLIGAIAVWMLYARIIRPKLGW